MIACVDVDYKLNKACAAFVVFENWNSSTAYSQYKVIVNIVADYEPGNFYKRELPCIVKVLELVEEEVEAVVVDGYVWLSSDKKPGLGWYLYAYLKEKTAVIGVAKTEYRSGNIHVCEVFRGISKKPLYITAIGINLSSVAENIKRMHGENRIPSILKKADKLSKSW